ncbi:hypothetical protein [Candidatus Methylomirabilis sp.]|uniref:hypothetical protein n=1 Tax=Candidatus Methylomirabilis sp. TaxID=2032687 RepID=UPI0030763045
MKPAKVLPKSFLLDTQNLDISVYEKVIEEYVHRFSRRKGVLWIGRFGAVTTPGASDIDLILVCEDEWCRVLALDSDEFVTQSPLHRYLFIHEVYVVPHSGVKYLSYFHSLNNLQSLWGDTTILNECEQPDNTIRLLRAVLWATSDWSKTLQLCQQDFVSLRSLLIRSKSLVTAAIHNYRLIGNEASVEAATHRIEQERQRILRADPSEQGDLARASFWGAVRTLAQSDWALRTWMIQEGLSDGRGEERKKIRLSDNQVIIFDDSHGSSYENLHQHVLGTHITYLPFFYYAIGLLAAQPILSLEPGLSRLWDVRGAARCDNVKLKRAGDNWNHAFLENVKEFRRAGIFPLALHVYPFNVKRVDSMLRMRRVLKHVLPSGVRRWLGARLYSQRTT